MYLIQRRADKPVVGFFPNIVKYEQDGIPNCEIVTLNCASVDFQVTFFLSLSSVLLKLPTVLIREDKKVSSLVDAFSRANLSLFCESSSESDAYPQNPCGFLPAQSSAVRAQ